MIPEKTTMKSCVGKHAITERVFRNCYAEIEKGREVIIVGSGSRGMTIKTESCSCCGVALLMRHVTRSDLTLAEDVM